MKIIVLLFASFSSIGFAYTEAVKEVNPQVLTIEAEVEQPVLHVMLDTVEITAKPAALASAR